MAAVSKLTSHLGFWLRQVSNHVSHAFALKLAATDVTVAEWALMRTLFERDPASPSQLADAMGLTRGAVTKLADRLIAKSLLERSADPGDGRAQRLALTQRGVAVVPDLAALADQNEAECFSHLSDKDRRLLERLLKDTTRRLGLKAIPLD